ncbi:LPS export ABC transporter permease LptG [Lysobacter pythonis]|uniref:LPS export ABC transporter permease LptG n=1 Tax=Solilutibacter pythonis TaxID=2483112 RepID=A0A3M2HYJ1_9GAMM|nr:LPS export ABC transporter permease LptG [Lysobacter pythonis]RMH93315.1 LPS export ABC transporter permease LptG [Lysobacter pythonis]
MKPFPRIHDRYIGKVVLVFVIAVWFVLVMLDFMLGGGGLMAQLDDLGKGSYGFADAFMYSSYTLPRRAYELFPTAAVIGALLGLGQLAASSELTALRALGLSRKRLSVSVALTIGVLTGLMVFSGETLGPWAERKANALKASATSPDMIVAQYSGLWAREGDIFLNAGSGQERTNGEDAWLELKDLRLYRFDEAGQLTSIAHAAVAEHRPGGWLLRNVARTHFDARSVRRETVAEERWESKLDAAALSASVAQPRYLDSATLKSSIDYRKRNQLDASEFESFYWGRWFYPLNVLALCLAAIPFAFGTLRGGGLGRRLFLGVVFALGFWLLQEMSARLAGAYKFDYRLAYVLPSVLMLTVSWGLFRRRSG